MAAVATWAGCLAVGSFLALDPHPVRTALVVALLVALSGLLADSAVDPSPEWHSDHRAREDWRGHDQRTGFYVHMLESHLTARSGDPAVRDRLVRLAEQTQRTRHGFDPSRAGATELTAPGLRDLADQPPRRLSREELDHWIGRIEGL